MSRWVDSRTRVCAICEARVFVVEGEMYIEER